MDMLDKLDRRVLYELDYNSRQSYSELARKVRQGRDRVSYRVERLVEEKIIRRFSIQVNLYKLGFTVFKIYFRLENNQERVEQLLSYLRSHPRVYWIARSEMSWDVMSAFFAKTPAEFHILSTKILSKFNDIIINFSMYTVVELWTYSKDYFLGSRGHPAMLSGQPEDIDIDRIDFDILKVLTQNCRMPTTEIAERVNTSPAVVKYRIEKLESQGVIAAYRTDIDHERLGMMLFKSSLQLRSHSSAHRKSLEMFIQESPNITAYVQQIGDCTLELELEARDYQHYYEIIGQLRERCAKLVRNFQTSLIERIHVSRLPEDMKLGVQRDERFLAL